jgi:hypothetical protein
MNWLEEMIARIQMGQATSNPTPGYTKTQMMTNQMPMGTPTQDPAQFSGPYYQTPYGGSSFVQESDVSAPLGVEYTRSLTGVAGEMGRRNAPGNYSNPYTLDYNYDTIKGSLGSHGSRIDTLDYNPRVSREVALRMLLDAAREKAIQDSRNASGK